MDRERWPQIWQQLWGEKKVRKKHFVHLCVCVSVCGSKSRSTFAEQMFGFLIVTHSRFGGVGNENAQPLSESRPTDLLCWMIIESFSIKRLWKIAHEAVITREKQICHLPRALGKDTDINRGSAADCNTQFNLHINYCVGRTITADWLFWCIRSTLVIFKEDK